MIPAHYWFILIGLTLFIVCIVFFKIYTSQKLKLTNHSSLDRSAFLWVGRNLELLAYRKAFSFTLLSIELPSKLNSTTNRNAIISMLSEILRQDDIVGNFGGMGIKVLFQHISNESDINFILTRITAGLDSNSLLYQ